MYIVLSHLLLHCSDTLCMQLSNYNGKHDKYCTSFTPFQKFVLYALYV